MMALFGWGSTGVSTETLRPRAGVLCSATSGAEYIDGHALIGITVATRCENGRSVPPFAIIIGPDDLRHHLRVGDDLQRSRSA
ncbi:MAG: hypothetical protein JWN00_3112 [Actinomycetia bacterium]|nr:hypothetical protein [Actinomycetes bacterium]